MGKRRIVTGYRTRALWDVKREREAVLLSGIGQTDGLVERLLRAGSAGDAGHPTWLAGIAVVVGIMLWAAGARAVSLAFAAAGGTAGLFAGFTLANQINIPEVGGLPGALVAGAGGAAVGVVIALVAMRLVVSATAGVTAAAAVAGIAILVTPHLPPQLSGTQTGPNSTSAVTQQVQPAAFSQPLIQQVDGVWTDPAESQAQTPTTGAAPSLGTQEIVSQAKDAWGRVPQEIQGEAALAVLAAGLLGAMLGAVWPARVASATTAFMGAAIWPIGAIQMQAAAGTPLPIEDTPAQTWLLAWLVLGIVGLGIQRLVVRKVAES